MVLTSVFRPTAAVRRFAERADDRMIVVGDRRIPEDWSCEGVEYMSPAAQVSTGWRTAELLPWDHYARKMVGYLRAIERGSEAVADTDDDNLPHADWGFPDFEGPRREVATDSYYNVYSRYTDERVWPRGFPLSRVMETPKADESARACRVGVWQGLANGDPDVDAIYRLTVGSEVDFRDGEPIVLAPGTVCPFNSQNTLFSREAFPLLYLPATVTFRSTDIIRGLVAQPVLWAAGLSLGFLGPTVTQDRNAHDLLDDFESEIPLYLATEAISDAAASAVSADASIEDNLRSAYVQLASKGMVDHDEVVLLDAWLEDLAYLNGGSRAGA